MHRSVEPNPPSRVQTSVPMNDLSSLDSLYDATRRIGLRDSLDEVVEEVLDRARELIGFEHCALMLRDPDSGRLAVRRVRGYHDRREAVLELTLDRGQGLSGWAAEQRRAVRVGDVTRHPRYVEGLKGARSNLVVPLMVGNEVAGVINVESEEPDAFTEEDQKLLTILGAQAALAIVAARARRGLQDRLRQLDAVYRISRLASQQDNLDATLERILEISREILPQGQVAILLRDDEDRLRVRQAKGYAAGVEEIAIPVGEGVTGRCAAAARPIVVDRVQDDPDYIEGVPRGRSELAVPLRVEGDVIGVLDAEATEPHAFGEEEARALSVIAQQVAAVIQTLRLHEETRQLAITDSLTGLRNRRHFLSQFEEHVRRSDRYGEDLALLLLDCDELKGINDRFGHLCGDLALEAVGQLLRNTLRETDETARIGGDEFAALLLNADRGLTREVTERLRTGIEDIRIPTAESDETVEVTISTGIAFFPDDARDARTLLRRADEALYLAKREGRNLVVCYGEVPPEERGGKTVPSRAEDEFDEVS